jgi:hypothetical protein
MFARARSLTLATRYVAGISVMMRACMVLSLHRSACVRCQRTEVRTQVTQLTSNDTKVRSPWVALMTTCLSSSVVFASGAKPAAVGHRGWSCPFCVAQFVSSRRRSIKLDGTAVAGCDGLRDQPKVVLPISGPRCRHNLKALHCDCRGCVQPVTTQHVE